MTRFRIVALCILGVLILGATLAPSISSLMGVGASGLAAPVGSDLQTAVANAKTATSAPFNPGASLSDANPSSLIDLSPRFDQTYTLVSFLVEYPSGQTLTTDPVIYVWGRAGSTGAWVKLVDADGSSSTTVADSATNYDNGTVKRTTPVSFTDLQGCNQFTATIGTAAVTSGGGAASLKARTF